MIDFSALVLGPAMAAFAGSVTVTTGAGAPYDARGSFTFKPVEVVLEGEGGGFHQTNQPELGIKLDEWNAGLRQSDVLVRKAGTPATPGALPDGTWLVHNILKDGQGGATLVLRQTS